MDSKKGKRLWQAVYTRLAKEGERKEKKGNSSRYARIVSGFAEGGKWALDVLYTQANKERFNSTAIRNLKSHETEREEGKEKEKRGKKSRVDA